MINNSKMHKCDFFNMCAPNFLGIGLRSQSFEPKNWFEEFTNRWFCIEIQNNYWKCESHISKYIKSTNLDTKLTACTPFEPIFVFERLRTYPAPNFLWMSYIFIGFELRTEAVTTVSLRFPLDLWSLLFLENFTSGL
jgi:hypothetical protein